MIQILPEVPSFGTSFARGIGKGIGEGANKGIEFAREMRKDKAAAEEKKQKELVGRKKGVNLASFRKASKEFQDLPISDQIKHVQDAERLLEENPDISPDEALAHTISSAGREREQNTTSQRRRSPHDQYQGGLIDLLRGTAQERPIEPLLKKAPGAVAASFGIGALEPIEEITRATDPAFPIRLGMQLAEKMRGQNAPKATPNLSEQAREKAYEGLSEDERQTLGQTEFAGAFLPFEKALAGLAKMGKMPILEKIFGKISKAKGVSEADIAEKVATSAASKGVDLEKVAAGDVREADKFLKLSADVSKEFPKATAARAEKVAAKRPVFKEPEASALRKKELEMFPEYRAEAEAYQAERMERRSRVKRAETIAKEGDRMKVAEKEFPKAKADYERMAGQVRALEDEMAKIPEAQKARVKGLLDYAERELKVAEETFSDLMNMSRTGEARMSIPDMERAAFEKVKNISADVEAGKEVALTKRDFNPERIKEADRLSRSKKQLPSRMKPFDKLFQAHETYKSAYMNRLAEIKNELAEIKNAKSLNEARRANALKKEQKIFEDLIDHINADLKLHEHQLNLRNLLARQKAEKTFKSLKSGPTTAQQMKTESVFRGSPKEFRNIKNTAREYATTGTKAEEAAAKMKIPVEDLKAGTEAIQQETQGILGSFEKIPSFKGFVREWKKFTDALKVNPKYKAFIETPMGRAIFINVVLNGLEQATGEKVPYGATVASWIGSPAGTRGISIIMAPIWKAISKARNEVNKSRYREAVRSGDLEMIKKAKEKLKSKDVAKLRKEQFTL